MITTSLIGMCPEGNSPTTTTTALLTTLLDKPPKEIIRINFLVANHHEKTCLEDLMRQNQNHTALKLTRNTITLKTTPGSDIYDKSYATPEENNFSSTPSRDRSGSFSFSTTLHTPSSRTAGHSSSTVETPSRPKQSNAQPAKINRSSA